MKKECLLSLFVMAAGLPRSLGAAPTLITDQSAYVNGATPLYVITGAPPGSTIHWISVKNGASTGEGDLASGRGVTYSGTGQVVGPDGRWYGYGGTWNSSLDGSWTKIAVFDDGSTAGTRFVVGPQAKILRNAQASKILGVATWQSEFASGSSLQEGANLVNGMGSKNIKIAMTPNALNADPSGRDYPGVNFGSATSLEDLAKSAPFQHLFSMPFQNYDIDAVPLDGSPHIPINLDTGRLQRFDPTAVKKEMHDLAYYLLSTYQNTGKTFTLQDWEGDNVLAQNAGGGPVTPDEITRMRQWEQARYDGVEEAREELKGVTGVSVQVAIEFNSLDKPRQDQPSMLTDVIPYVDSDLVSYSAYDSIYRTPTNQLSSTIANDMAFIKGFTNKPLMIGEFGESSNPAVNPFAADLPQRITYESQAFAKAGAQSAYYWQIVDTQNYGDAGYGLINHDGVHEPAYTAIENLLQAPSSTVANAARSIGRSSESAVTGLKGNPLFYRPLSAGVPTFRRGPSTTTTDLLQNSQQIHSR